MIHRSKAWNILEKRENEWIKKSGLFSIQQFLTSQRLINLLEFSLEF